MPSDRRGSLPWMAKVAYEDARAALDEVIEWALENADGTRNEATTRLHVIDELLTRALGWSKAQIVAEESYGGKYADYCLGRPATRLIVEAKREGVYFELPSGVGSGVLEISTLLEVSADISGAINQVLAYCYSRGVPIAAVSNGQQLIAFLASRQDAVPPLAGKALVFDSLDAMRDDFPCFWNNLSRDGVEALNIHATVGDVDVAAPPPKLAARIPDYPGYWRRNRIQNELKILGDVVLEDIPTAPELEDEFLRQCYSATPTLSEYALVSREIIEARYSALASLEGEATEAPARTSSGLSGDLQTDVLAGSLARRPLILLGDVGVGKSIFIRHFVKVAARDLMERSVVLSIDFGVEPALAESLRDYIMDRFVEQLREYGIDVEADKFVRNVYHSELKSFAEGVHRRLEQIAPDQYAVKEIALLERKLTDRGQHLRASLRYITRNLHRQVIVFLDNIDQRDFGFQEQVFLIGQSLAATWPATVFLSLRPETFYRSRNVGSLTAYQPRVFTIAPPAVGRVIQKRLRFCRGLVDDPEQRGRILPEALDPQASVLSTYLRVLSSSFASRDELVECVENLSGGNVRSALGFLNTFVGSGHVDTRKIFGIAEETGNYTVALHEFVRSIVFGDYQYFDPSASPIANVFEISSPDGREHFLLPILLAHVDRVGAIGRQDGYVDVSVLLSLAQSLGFVPSQVEFALRHGVDKRLLHLHPGAEDTSRRYRISTIGAYTYRKLMGMFVYVDSMIVDTPIVDKDVSHMIDDSQAIEDRKRRVEVFRAYLDEQWRTFEGQELVFNWTEVSAQLDTDYARIERALANHFPRK